MQPYGDCIHCGGEVVERVERVDYRIRGQLYILERVPTRVCSQCGEQFFTAETAKRMEHAVENTTGNIAVIPIPVLAVK